MFDCFGWMNGYDPAEFIWILYIQSQQYATKGLETHQASNKLPTPDCKLQRHKRHWASELRNSYTRK
jgi:hypothetical protein